MSNTGKMATKPMLYVLHVSEVKDISGSNLGAFR
jgi:hypothetical protein